MRKIFLAFLTTSSLSFPTSALAADDSEGFPTRKARVVVSTPGQQINLLGGFGGSNSSKKEREQKNEGEPMKAPPKYSMQPIMESEEASDDEPPGDFEPEQADKPKVKEAKAVNVKENAPEKKRVPFTPVPKSKPAVSRQKDEVDIPQKPENAPAAPIQPKIVNVETNAPAVQAEVAKPKPADSPKAPKIAVPEDIKQEAVIEKKPAEKEAKKNEVKAKAKAEFTSDADIEKLKFTFSRPTAAAVFERFGYYWLVFYSDEQVDLPENLKNSKLFAGGKKISAVKSQLVSNENISNSVNAPLIFNLEMNKSAYAMVQKMDNSWELDFDPGIDYKQDGAVKLIDKPQAWQVAADGLTARITVKDEFTNDYIEIFPLLQPRFNAQKVANSKFIFEKTVQGLVIKSIGQVEINSPQKDILAISKDSAAPKPAAIGKDDSTSAATQPTEKKSDDQAAQPLYPFKKWPQLKADEYRKAEAKLQTGERIDLGKFLFSQGLYSEAAVNLQGERGVDASFLTGASYFAIGHYDDAAKIFDSLALPENVDKDEILMWKGATSFELSQINPAVAEQVDISSLHPPKNLGNYPDEIRNRLILAIAEEDIENSKYDLAAEWLNLIPKTVLDSSLHSYVQFLQARIYDGQGKHDRARETWAAVKKAATDRESQAKSAYEIIMQDYNAKKTSLADAVKQLNDIRILWRGDIFEYNLLYQLADLSAKNGDAYAALTISKEILSSFPNFPRNLVLANQMRELYLKELSSNFSDKDKTFRAVTIYYEFEELKPPGDAGNQISLQLADALARYDLLADATKVLRKYAENIKDPAQKAEIGTRIAILDYLNNKPKDSLQDLKDSYAADIPNFLVQERKILEVRCLIETGDLQKATSMLSSLPDEQANRFKADIYWKAKDWSKMLDTYDLLTQKNDDDIMRMGIAMVMVDDRAGLQNLSKRYGAQMEKSKYADSFNYVTDTENVDYRNLDASLKLDRTEQLLGQYRERIKTSGLAAVTGGKQAP